jgi:hypothetical protein
LTSQKTDFSLKAGAASPHHAISTEGKTGERLLKSNYNPVDLLYHI